MPGRGEDGRTEPRPSPRNKRAEIVAVATEYFGENGYEDTKWADVATAVGLGPTALYHYFESKQQCLFEILVEAIEEARAEFLRASQGDFAVAFPAVVGASFERNDREVRRARVLVAEQGLVRHPRPAPREEDGPPARLLPGQGVRGGLARSARRRDGGRGDPDGRRRPARPRRDRHLQQRLALVPAGGPADPVARSPTSTCRACWRWPVCRG